MKYHSLRKFWHLRRSLEKLRGRRRLQGTGNLWHALAPILDRSASRGCTFYELDALYTHVRDGTRRTCRGADVIVIP
jgi:hypothetical protein